MRYLSTFSGIEAASVAWQGLGFEAVGYSEINPFASAVLAARFPKTRNYGDITKHASWGLKPGSTDILIGGSPCQSFSICGKKLGFADPRGNLTLTFLQLIEQLRPQWVVWENVPNCLSTNGGRDFGSFLHQLVSSGYGCCWRVLDARHQGSPRPLPQRRRRVYLIANLTSVQHSAEVLFKPQALQGDADALSSLGQDAAAHLEGSPYADCQPDLKMVGFQIGNLRRRAGATPDDRFITCLKSSTGDQTPCVAYDGKARHLTSIEWERLQGFPDNHTQISWKGKPPEECPDHLRQIACGNSMAVPIIRMLGERIKAVHTAHNLNNHL